MDNEIYCYSQVLGQGRAADIVARTFAADRIPHAYLFRGPDGVGKRLFARGLAAAVNCRGAVKGRACGECISCRKMLSGNHPDYSEISSEKGSIKIDQVRSLCRELSFPPYESKMRVVVVEDVHTMRPEAANSLLKTLEEPPANNLLILTAESSHTVLNTISSRCQSLAFHPLEPSDILQAVTIRDVEESGQKILARLAGGSPGRMVQIAQGDLLAVWSELFQLLSSADNYRELCDDRWLHCAALLACLKDELPEAFALLRLCLRDQLFYHAGVLSAEQLQKQWGGELFVWSKTALYSGLADIDCAEKKLRHNCNIALVCEVLLFAFQSKK